jgi:hypothetical protein
MPTTDNYGLPTGMVADDFIEPDHQNLIADTLDRVVGCFLRNIMSAGVLDGWELTGDANVAAGEGIISGCYCETTAAQDITGLTNDAVNYVFAQTDGTSATQGSVVFSAQTPPTAPPGAIYLGTVTLDAGGAVTDYNSAAEGVDRNLYRLEIQEIGGDGTETGVADGASVTIEVDHSSEAQFVLPGAISVECNAGFDCTVKDAHQGGGFTIEATNTSGATADLTHSWTRQGIAG